MEQVPITIIKVADFIESQIPKAPKMCPLKELSFWLISRDGQIQSNANHIIDKIFTRGPQWDIVSMQIGGFDIQQIETETITAWLKHQKNLRKLNLVHCGMTPAILASILETLPTIICDQPEDNPDDEDFTPVELAFDQNDGEQLLVNDETREHICAFFAKIPTNREIEFSCNQTIIYDWSRDKQDPEKITISYLSDECDNATMLNFTPQRYRQ